MKVLAAPAPAEWTKQSCCSTCRTRVEIELRDLKMGSDQRDGNWFEWTCPTCRSRSIEDEGFVPREMWFALTRST